MNTRPKGYEKCHDFYKMKFVRSIYIHMHFRLYFDLNLVPEKYLTPTTFLLVIVMT